MGWEDILKIKLRGKSDINRLGLETSLDDMIEGATPSQEEFEKLSERERETYHSKMARWLKIYGKTEQHKREGTWHMRQFNRYRSKRERGVGSTLILPRPLNEDDYDFKFNTSGANLTSKDRVRFVNPRKKGSNFDQNINKIIIDYFKIYNRMYNRNPTLQEIKDDEGRPLSVDEIESFERYAQSR